MEAVIAQFTLLSNQACQDENFDLFPNEDSMKLFEIEAYNTWAAMELYHEYEVEEAETTLQKAEECLDLGMESAMDEFIMFEKEMERMEREELHGLVITAEKARKMGKLMEKAATFASKKYIEAAMKSASAYMKSVLKGIPSSNRVHPS